MSRSEAERPKNRNSFVVAAAAGALACASFILALGAQNTRPPQDPELPPGPMQAKAQTACMECHESRIITQQRLSKDAWTKEVDKMVRWGTVLDPKDRDPLIDYLSANFPPEKPAEPAPRLGKGK